MCHLHEHPNADAALRLAARDGCDECARRLMEARGADLRSRSEGGLCAVHIAVMYDRALLASMLASRAPDATTAALGWTALHAAVHYRASLCVLDGVVAAGVDVSARATDRLRSNAIELAIAMGHQEQARALVDRHGARVGRDRLLSIVSEMTGARARGSVADRPSSPDPRRAITRARSCVRAPADDQVEMLRGAYEPRVGAEILAALVEKVGSLRQVKRFIEECGADERRVVDGRTLLHVAMARKNAPHLTYLLARDTIDVNFRDDGGDAVLHQAVKGGQRQIQMADALIDAAPRLELDLRNAEGKTALHLCVERSRANFFRALVRKGASLRARDSTGNTPLHLACKSLREDDALLVFRELDVSRCVDIADSAGMTPLHSACQMLKTTAVSFLVDRGASATRLCSRGFTPAYVMAMAVTATTNARALISIAERLGKAGMDAQTRQGSTPISVLLWHQHYRTVATLMERLQLSVLTIEEDGTMPVALCPEGHAVRRAVLDAAIREGEARLAGGQAAARAARCAVCLEEGKPMYWCPDGVHHPIGCLDCIDRMCAYGECACPVCRLAFKWNERPLNLDDVVVIDE